MKGLEIALTVIGSLAMFGFVNVAIIFLSKKQLLNSYGITEMHLYIILGVIGLLVAVFLLIIGKSARKMGTLQNMGVIR